MKAYIVQYRINGGKLHPVRAGRKFFAASAASAIADAVVLFAHLECETLDLIATEQSE